MKNLLDKLPIFLACVEQGSFAAAARKLRLSRSAVAKAVAALEFRLGVRLFHRSTRTISLTVEGAVLYEATRRSLSELDVTIASLSDSRDVARGTLRVTVPLALGRPVARILSRLVADHDELKLEFTFTDRFVNLVDEGLDLAVRVGPLPDSSTLAARKIATMQMCLCASTNFLAANRVDRISSLEQVDTVNYRIGGRSFPWELRNQQGKLTQISPMARITFDDLGAILEAIEADLAVGWLPRWMISDKLASDALVEILPESLGDGFPIYAVWPQSPVMPVRVRLAIDLIALELPPLLES